MHTVVVVVELVEVEVVLVDWVVVVPPSPGARGHAAGRGALNATKTCPSSRATVPPNWAQNLIVPIVSRIATAVCGCPSGYACAPRIRNLASRLSSSPTRSPGAVRL